MHGTKGCNNIAIGYHFALSQHKNSILETGLRRSKSGLDGPGIYIYKAPLRKALSEAGLSIADSHYPNDCSHVFANLIVLEIQYDEKDISIEWADYIVLDIDGIPADKIKYIGGFNRLNAETT